MLRNLQYSCLRGFQIGHPIGSFILGREGGFKLGTLLAVSFWGGRGGFELGTILAVSFWEGGRGGTSAGRLVNFDSFSEIGYRTP